MISAKSMATTILAISFAISSWCLHQPVAVANETMDSEGSAAAIEGTTTVRFTSASLCTDIDSELTDSMALENAIGGIDSQLFDLIQESETPQLSNLMDESNCLHCRSSASRIPEPSPALCTCLFLLGLIVAHCLRRRVKLQQA